jgi:hypothetical protein
MPGSSRKRELPNAGRVSTLFDRPALTLFRSSSFADIATGERRRMDHRSAIEAHAPSQP